MAMNDQNPDGLLCSAMKVVFKSCPSLNEDEVHLHLLLHCHNFAIRNQHDGPDLAAASIVLEPPFA